MAVDGLLLELGDYDAPDAAAGAARDAVVALLEGAGVAALARSHHAPGHVTASGWVVDEGGERVLLVWHRFLQRWLQPGGHVDPNDVSVRDAALREVREETGLEGEIVGGVVHVDVHVIPANDAKGEPEHLHHDVRWIVRVRGDAPRAGDDVELARWFRWSEIAGLDTDDSVRVLADLARSRLSSGSRGPRG